MKGQPFFIAALAILSFGCGIAFNNPVPDGGRMVPGENPLGEGDPPFMCPSVTGGLLVEPVYSAAPNWNDYFERNEEKIWAAVDNGGVPGVGEPCNGDDTVDFGSRAGVVAGAFACENGGQVRKLAVGAESDCTGFTAEDDLGAFDWECDDSSGSVVFYSVDLKQQARISDLLLTDGTGWEMNHVRVKRDGCVYYESAPSDTWWANPVRNLDGLDNVTAGATAVAGVTGYNTLGTPDVDIYELLTNDPPPVYTYSQDRNTVGLAFDGGKNMMVVMRGVTLTHNGVENNNASCNVGNNSLVMICLSGEYNWVEGAFDGNFLPQASLFAFGGTKNFIRIRQTHMRRSGAEALRLPGGTGTTRVEFSSFSENTGDGIILTNSPGGGVIRHSRMTNNNYGIYHRGPNWKLFGNTLVNNVFQGIYHHSTPFDCVFALNTTAHNGGMGFRFGAADNTVIIGHTSGFNSDRGLSHSVPTVGIVTQLLASANGTAGLRLAGDGTLAKDLAVAHNGSNGISIPGTNMTVDGQLFVGNNTTGCSVTGSANVVDDNGSGACGGSAGTLSVNEGVDLATSVRGLVSVDDVNAHSADILAGAGTVGFGSITDWTNFDNPFRSFGAWINGDHTNLVNVSRCTAGTCGLWDWSLMAGDAGFAGAPALLNVLACPTGAEFLTMTWSDFSTTDFLEHAVEILGDGIGDDDLLCESGEACIFMPNIGAYQGHGALLPASTVSGCSDVGTGGTIQNVTLYQYENNGY